MFVELDAGTATRFLEAATDIVLHLDSEGRIKHLTIRDPDLARQLAGGWRGVTLIDTVSDESRDKAERWLGALRSADGQTVEGDFSHVLPDGSQLPVHYSALRIEPDQLLAMGRDLRPMAELRQQLLNAQQALEKDYWRLRQVETRYRMLLQMVADAVLVLDESSGRILEANAVVGKLLGVGGRSVIGKSFPLGFDRRGSNAVTGLLAETRALGKASLNDVRSADGKQTFTITTNLLRQDSDSRILVRIADATAGADAEAGGATWAAILRHAPDAVALTDTDGRIQAVNQSFVDLAQLANADQARNQSIDRWLGRTGVDLNVLLNNLRQRDTVKLFATTLHGEHGTVTDVEISAARVPGRDEPLVAFFVRDIARRVSADHPMTTRLPSSVDQVTQQVGRVPLKDLVRESTDIIEALCIETALELTDDNRASAAELLGLSRQSLYAKLRRHGIGGVGAAEEA